MNNELHNLALCFKEESMSSKAELKIMLISKIKILTLL